MCYFNVLGKSQEAVRVIDSGRQKQGSVRNARYRTFRTLLFIPPAGGVLSVSALDYFAGISSSVLTSRSQNFGTVAQRQRSFAV